MRTLQARFAPDALSTLDTVLKHTKDVRVFRRAQAVREVVKGRRVKAVSTSFAFTYSALRKWIGRFVHEGPQGLVDRPRPGRPRKVTEAVSTCILHLVDQDPVAHGALSSQWNCRELGTAVAHHTGVKLHPDTIRGVLKRGA
jgi:transposase